MKKFPSLILAAAATVALMAGPSFAQQSPSGSMSGGGSMAAPATPAPSQSTMPMQSGNMSGMPMGKSAAPKKAAARKPAARKAPMRTASAGKRTCMDYAWQSQDEKQCEAGQMKPPTWH